MMAEVIDGELVDARQPPPSRYKTRAEIELLPAMQISIGQEVDRFNCGAPVDTAAVEPRDVARTAIRVIARRALDVFEIVFLAFDDDAAGPRQSVIRFKAFDGRRDKAAIKPLVAVHQADVVARAVLVPKLGTDATAAVLGARQGHDANGVLLRDLDS